MNARSTTSNGQPAPSYEPEAANTHLGVRMHRAMLRLESNHLPLMAYAAEHLQGLAETRMANPNLVVKCFWSQGEWDKEANPFGSAEDTLNVIGKRMLGSKNELIWLDTLRLKGLQLRFRREARRFVFDVAYRFHPKKEKIENLPEYEYKKFFSLMSYLVYYPLIWHLETFRGWTILHASALATARGGIIIGGLGGVGKTTTCVALMQRPGISLISENIIFTDGELIYPCYEPIRLDEGSLAMLGENPHGLSRMAFPEGLKEKWLFHLKKKALPEKVQPVWMFLPQFSSRHYVKPLPSEAVAEKILAMNRLTRELDDYGWYAAALDMHWPKAGQASNRINALHRLAQQVRCYELGIDRSAGVEAVVEDILKTIQS
jgi:hypothetical protein